MQEAQRRNVGSLAILEEYEIAIRVQNNLHMVGAFAHIQRRLLREDVVNVRLQAGILLQDGGADGALLGRADGSDGLDVLLLGILAEHGCWAGRASSAE